MALLSLPWLKEPFPQVGDILLARKAGGWVLTKVVPPAEGHEDRWHLSGDRFEGPEPPARRGCVVHTYASTGLVLPMRANPEALSEVQQVRPVTVVSEAEVAERARASKERSAAADEALPLKSSPAEWSDPDSPISQRVPKTVRGRRRCDQLGKLAKQSPSVTRLHILAMEAVKTSYDIATHGLSSGTNLADCTGRGSHGPSSGPSKAAMRTLEHEREVAALFGALGPAAAHLVQDVVLQNRGIPSFCQAHLTPQGVQPDRKLVLGRLLAAFDHVVTIRETIDDQRNGRAARQELRRRD